MTRVDTHPLATANTAELTVPTSRLWTVNATIGYDKRVINENLSVSIPDESFTVIVGPNACGKSTLLRGLSRLLKPGSGRVVLDGQDIHSYKAKEVARKLGSKTMRNPPKRPARSGRRSDQFLRRRPDRLYDAWQPA